MGFSDNLNDYIPAVAGLHGASAVTNTEWFSANTIIEEQTLAVQMNEKQISMLTEEVSVLLSIAVEFGMVGFTGQPQEVKYAGCGKVMKVS